VVKKQQTNPPSVKSTLTVYTIRVDYKHWQCKFNTGGYTNVEIIIICYEMFIWTHFRMNFSDREKAKRASCLFFFIWQKAELCFYCEYAQKKTIKHLLETQSYYWMVVQHSLIFPWDDRNPLFTFFTSFYNDVKIVILYYCRRKCKRRDFCKDYKH